MHIVMYFHQNPDIEYPDVFHFNNQYEAEDWVERHRYKNGPDGECIQGGWGGKFVLTETIDPVHADNPDKLLGFDFPNQRIL
jgi:hypothetical protein